jgi:hypothetical protein
MRKPKILTEHQREVLSQKRSDIPAMYSDLSQQSHPAFFRDSNSDTQGSQHAFPKTESASFLGAGVPLTKPTGDHHMDMDEVARSSPPPFFSASAAAPKSENLRPRDDGEHEVIDVDDDEVMILDVTPRKVNESQEQKFNDKRSESSVEVMDGPKPEVEEVEGGVHVEGPARTRKQVQPKKREAVAKKRRGPAGSPQAGPFKKPKVIAPL